MQEGTKVKTYSHLRAQWFQLNFKEGAREITFWITLVSQFIGAFATVLSALMFICCTAITICTKATSAVDPRLNRVLPNGTVVPKDNMFTQAAAEKGTQNFWFCKMLNSEWFSDARFDIDCAIIEENEKAGNFLTKPKPFGERYSWRHNDVINNSILRCYNPIEVGVLGFIMATASFQLLLLMLFLFANYWDNKPKMNKITPKEINSKLTKIN